MGKDNAQHKAQHCTEHKAHQGFLQRKERGLGQNCQQKGVAAPARRLENRADDFADVGHGPVIGADGQLHLAETDGPTERARGLLSRGFHRNRPGQIDASRRGQQLIAFPEQGKQQDDE